MGDRSDGAPERPGRLHGRLLKVLGLVSVVSVLVAVWQLSSVWFQDEQEAAATWPWQDQASVDFADEEPSTEAAEGSSETGGASAEPSPEVSGVEPEPEPPATSSEAAPATEAAEPESAPEPEGPACAASLWIGEQWRNSGGVRFDMWLEVVNTGGESIEGWEVTLAFDGVDVFASWGVEHDGGGRYEAARWNDELEPGESAAAGFQAAADDEVDLPDTVPCKPLRK